MDNGNPVVSSGTGTIVRDRKTNWPVAKNVSGSWVEDSTPTDIPGTFSVRLSEPFDSTATCNLYNGADLSSTYGLTNVHGWELFLANVVANFRADIPQGTVRGTTGINVHICNLTGTRPDGSTGSCTGGSWGQYWQ
jgi:hypothetical protein